MSLNKMELLEAYKTLKKEMERLLEKDLVDTHYHAINDARIALHNFSTLLNRYLLKSHDKNIDFGR